jgi:hypothetical protein
MSVHLTAAYSILSLITRSFHNAIVTVMPAVTSFLLLLSEFTKPIAGTYLFGDLKIYGITNTLTL